VAISASSKGDYVIKNVAELAQLRDSSDVLDDHDELRRRWNSDGYIFVRAGIDNGAVDKVRRAYMERLAAQGLVESVDGEAVWTGRRLKSDRAISYKDLNDSVWKDLVSHPSFDRVMRAVMGEAPSWVPIVSYRASLPVEEVPEDLFIGRHQDAFYNQGINFWNVWVPLMDIPGEVGGLAIAPRRHQEGFLHRGPRAFTSKEVPDEEWLRADYAPGDILIFNNMTPHSAMVNTSNLIRLSIDVRAIPESDVQPVIGTISSISDESLGITTDDGEVTLRVDDGTYFRGVGRSAHHPEPGEHVIVSTDDTGKLAVVVRLAT
jgi:hypothetical protein